MLKKSQKEMSRGHSWKSFKVPEPESRLLHILKWMVRWQDQTSSDSAPCLYSQILSNAGQGARARTNGVFILRCTFLDLECKILDWQARPLSKQSLSFLLSVWYPSCHDHDTFIYFDPQERFRKLARERRDQRSREKERQNESKRAAETVRRAASKTLETFEIMLALVQIPRRDQCPSRTWEFMKSQKLVSPLDHFSNRSLELQ